MQSVDVMFFRSFQLSEVRAKIDYVSKRTNLAGLREGNYIELLNVVPLENMKLILPAIRRVAIPGPSEIGVEIGSAWLDALMAEQMYRCARGITFPPIDSLANIMESAANVVLLPMKEYQRGGGSGGKGGGGKGGGGSGRDSSGARRKVQERQRRNARVMKSARSNVSKFAKSLTYETASNMSRMATAAHGLVSATSEALAENEYDDDRASDVRHRSGSRSRTREKKRRGKGRTQYYQPVLSTQPKNPLEGVHQAVGVAASRMKKMARTVIMLPVASYQKQGLTGATRSVIRAVPVAILEPIQIVTESVSRLTLGLRNWVDPSKKEEEDKKWKRPKGR